MIFNRKIQLKVNNEQTKLLDSQSKICNWLYNQLLDLCITDYNNGNENKYLSGRKLRDQVPVLKRTNCFLYTVHSSPLKNAALRVQESYKRFFKQGSGYPKFKAWKSRWFSLYYDEPNKGFKIIDNKTLQISFGKNEEGKQLRIHIILKESINLSKFQVIKTMRIIKELGNYYVVFGIESFRYKRQKEEVESWIALDPNHKNLMTGITNQCKTYEFKNLYMIKYWDKKIDELKSKRDKCKRKSIYVKREVGKNYWLPSKRWNKYNKALRKAYNVRREQIKQAFYAIANFLVRHFDLMVIGDYTPSLETAKYKNMHRSVLNQTMIAQFRNILGWVCQRSFKLFRITCERGTTATCCICGDYEKKDPTIRSFICKKCKNLLNRDVNSSINISKKENLTLSGSDYIGMRSTMYAVEWVLRSCKLRIQEN